jgi:hypothetical protein
MAKFHVPLPKLRGISVRPSLGVGGVPSVIPAFPIQRRMQQWIWFLNLPFAGPTAFDVAHKPTFGGLYAIMVFDATCTPLPYRLIYVGETGNLAERVCRSHEKYPSWVRAAGGRQLFVAFHAIENSLLRRAAEQRLIGHYRPACNETFNPNALQLKTLLGLSPDALNWPFNL